MNPFLRDLGVHDCLVESSRPEVPIIGCITLLVKCKLSQHLRQRDSNNINKSFVYVCVQWTQASWLYKKWLEPQQHRVSNAWAKASSYCTDITILSKHISDFILHIYAYSSIIYTRKKTEKMSHSELTAAKVCIFLILLFLQPLFF